MNLPRNPWPWLAASIAILLLLAFADRIIA